MKRLWLKGAPIIDSLFEVDVYKFTMLYFIFRFFPELRVKFAFTNRNLKIRLVDRIDIRELREEILHVMTLKFSEAQLEYLRSWRLFPERFIQWLKELKLPEPIIRKTPEGQYSIEVYGLWLHVTLWELFILPIMSQLNTRYCVEQSGASHQTIIAEGEKRLLAKIENFKKLHWLIALFGLRRRASGLWERRATEMLLDLIPKIISGTSNVQIAMELGIEAKGTMAHEIFSALYALRRHESYTSAQESQYEVLDKWQQIYGHELLVMLPDTFGSSQFFKNLPLRYKHDWKGSRQDSGDPIRYGEMAISMYKDVGIDPTEKLALFTDGLDDQKCLKIEESFYGRINGGFGIGTFITNDFGPYIQAMPMVMKLVEAARRPAIKLSDNQAKAIGDPDEVAIGNRIFMNTNTFREECVY